MAEPTQVDNRGRSYLAVALGDIIRQLRTKRGLSPKQLAALVGLHVKSLAAYEQGHRRITVEKLVAVCEALDADPALVVDDALRARRMEAADG